MGIWILSLLWLLAIGVVLLLLNHYKNPRTFGWFIGLIVFLGFLFPFTLTFDLPIDVSSARYNLCLTLGGSEETCEKPFIYVAPHVLDIIWLLTYWFNFFLTWLIVPFIQGYVDTGEFGVTRRLKDSIKINIRYYALLFITTSIIIIYLLVSTSLRTWESVLGFLMSLGNAWGLTMSMIYLGHGLVQLPRALWKSANHRRSLARLEYMAPRFKEQLIDAQADLDEVIAEIQSLHKRPVSDPEVNALIDELICKTPLPEIDFMNGFIDASRSSNLNTPITREYLVDLNYRSKEAISHRGSSESRWKSLVEKAMHLQDVISNEHYNSGRVWTSTLRAPHRYKWIRFLQWMWRVKLESLLRRALAVIAVGLSLLILWSEVALISTNSDLSPISWIIHWEYLSPISVELFTLIVLLYVAVCTYSSFMKVRIFRYYLLVPHHTDEKSLLFFASYFCRIAFPLGYNYLMLVQGTGGKRILMTEFAKVMGPMDLIPVLGKNFNWYFSIGLILVCLLVFFRLHGVVAELFSSDPNFSFDDYSDNHEHLAEGRELINAARRQEERARNRSNDVMQNVWAMRSNLSNHSDYISLSFRV